MWVCIKNANVALSFLRSWLVFSAFFLGSSSFSCYVLAAAGHPLPVRVSGLAFKILGKQRFATVTRNYFLDLNI